ncbi:Na+/H+ antiporter subunit A [Arthrobacter sp. Sa2CUA1]|uniref:Na+/H+ antiporter subunit A n=1 Tax=Arthrobacter gallicola TaxID=2762225 RepID=A0ABR8UTC2_9MICC|nr:Na+/H+ antiporter subunit A [Arthrobacter gallicola]MBD7995783.1 Na+/H+ antiporter subunit A [Arthrobacter gallicola]
MLVVLTVLFTVALAAPLFFRWFGRSAFYILAAVPAGAFIWLMATFPSYTGADQSLSSGAPNAPPSVVIPWIPDLRVELAFRMDALSADLSILILGVGSLVLFYCARYFRPEDPKMGAFGSQLLAFAAAMFGLVTADDLILLFIFWELTTILSYLLIGYAAHRLSARRAALQALIVTTFGGLAMLVGMIMLGSVAGTYRISEIMAMAPELVASGVIVDVAIVLMLVGAVSKSALLPFHFWLPAAMAAPTPVSAYLHAAAMVKAGIYLIARLAPGFSETAYWSAVISVLGLATLLLGGWRALRQHDLKLMLAYGTVSQLGFLTLVVGLGNREAAIAGIGLLLAHGFFKATLFLVVGIIDHQAGTRDIRKLSGVGRSAPLLAAVAVIGAASMAGLPPLLGFVAKESVYETYVHYAGHENNLTGWILLIGVVAGAILTFAYSCRFVWGGFATKATCEPTAFKPVSWPFLAPPALLAAATLVFGLWPRPLDTAATPYADLYPADGPVTHLALWHGFTPALGLTGVTIAVGLLLFWQRERVERFQTLTASPLDAERSYRGLIGLLDDAAVWVTGRTQRGSLTFYLFVILSMAIISPLAAVIFRGAQMPENFHWFDSPVQAVIGAAVVIGALGAARANKRFLAVLMVSVSGYGIALIFALQGAPDLALTQMLVETIVLVAFVLALRSLPARLWKREPTGQRLLRALLGISFGAAMVVFAMSAMASRVAEPISLAYPELAYKGGGGLNIVNVTLVDIRAWDTFGEISVLTMAATGVASLIFIRGRGDKRRRADEVATGSVDRGREHFGSSDREAATLALARKFSTVAREAWLVAGRTLAPERRSIIFEVITRLLFHSVIVFSVYLLIAGHNAPGGGFAGGLMAGLALTIRYLAGGRFELAEATPVSAGMLLGGGLGLAALSAAAPLFFGGQILQTAILSFTWPVFGDIKFVTSTIFDIGVYLVVVGLVLDVLRSLGSEIDERSEGGSSDDEDLIEPEPELLDAEGVSR